MKLILAALIPLSADEAYYWVWSHRLQLSYFDHPPMVAWLFYIGHFLEPLMHAVRWPAVILGHAAIWFGIQLLKKYINLEQVRTWVYLVLFSPLLGFGSLIVTPDLPVIFFWIFSLYCFDLVLERKDLKSYALLGIALGLGFCAKYHIVLFVPCLVAYVLIEKKWNLINWRHVPATLAAGLIFCLPVIFWNYQNDFASFRFQIEHGFERPSYNPEWTISYVLAQIIIIFPWVLWAAAKAKPITQLRYLIYFAWVPLLFFFGTSFKALVEANWPIVAYPGVLMLAAMHPAMTKWKKYYVGFYGVLIVAVLIALFVPQIRDMNPKIGEPFILQNLAEETRDYRPLYADSYQMSSSLWYFSKSPVYKLKDISRFDFFDTLPEAKPAGNKFYLVKHEGNGLPAWVSEQQWTLQEVKKIAPDFVVLEITRP
ncbi:glycosyltransferase family 39 protein [Bdellovibrio sp. SKB1291214]|uniref:ArnT family glycosyltransferase n=1 Tax=Bdellovibrio sp. SKB1291214 TaxID=1732569 RepID=UPI0020CD9C43|nr:glycosyltransferase family 39 protein [Bdellovibrio sp. SKB1291214]UYL10623.1 glycosyltransferase family 39 protein [Bdellovibrio sp. SKB1291214]